MNLYAKQIIRRILTSILIILMLSLIFLIGNSKAPTLYNKPVQIITKDNTENPISIYNYKDSLIGFNGWEILLDYKQQDRGLGTNYQFELNEKQYKLYKDENNLLFLDKISPKGFFYKETDFKAIEDISKNEKRVYWYNEEKDPSKIGYIFTIQKTLFSTKPYFKLQLFADTKNPERLKEAGYGMIIKGYAIYLPNGTILKNDHKRIETDKPKDIILNGIKQDPTKPEFQNIVENKIILKGTNYKNNVSYQIFYNNEKAIILWGEFDYIDNLFKWEVFRPFFTKKESENTFKPLYIAILNEATLNYQNNTYIIDSEEFKGEINSLIKDWTF